MRRATSWTVVLTVITACNLDWRDDESAHDASIDPVDRPDAAAQPDAGTQPDAAAPERPDAGKPHEDPEDAGAEGPVCRQDETECEDGCANLQNDPKHCGDCTKACDEGEVCLEGECANDCGEQTRCEGNVCADLSSDVSHCTDCDIACPEPQANGHATCEGQCGIECDDTYRTCGTNCYKLDDPGHCGVDCKKCPVAPNTRATCNGTVCATECVVSTLQCAGGTQACGSWNFESGTTEGFSIIKGTAGPLEESTAHVSEGSYALSAAMTNKVGFKVQLCPGGAQTNVSYRTFSAKLYIDGPALLANQDDNYVQVYLATASGTPFIVEQSRLQTGTWITLTRVLNPSQISNLTTTTAVEIYLRLYQPGMSGWAGTAYLDDVRFE